MQPEIALSEKAAKKVESLIAAETSPCLRVFITGGGCNGFSYGFTRRQPSGRRCSDRKGGRKDARRRNELSYLVGADVDYVEDLGFTIYSDESQCGSDLRLRYSFCQVSPIAVLPCGATPKRFADAGLGRVIF